MSGNKRIIFVAFILILLLTAILGLTGCATKRMTQVMQTDTVYAERIVEVQKLLRDTIEINSTIVEFIPDSGGGWTPSKMVVEKNIKKRSQNSSGEHLQADKVVVKSEVEKKHEITKSSRAKWITLSLLTIILIVISIIKLKM